MSNPYKIYDRNQGPPWLKQLDKYIETPKNNATKILDATVAERNHGGNEKLIKKATYAEGKK